MKSSFEIPENLDGLRLDQALACLCPEYSRARLQKWIKQGDVLLSGKACRPRDSVAVGQTVEIAVAAVSVEVDESIIAQDLPLTVVYEDADLIIIDKPQNLVVHPAAGNREGTLQNGLLFHYPELSQVPRAGIVHRLDKDTTGLMVVARTLKSHTELVRQLQAREMGREYEAVVHGVMISGGLVDAPIGRHPVDRKRMAVTQNGKSARTHYRVLDKFKSHTHVRLKLESGRTHQIRVHMSHIRYPIVGDPVYGGRRRVPAGASQEIIALLQGFSRQALHAAHLELVHPSTQNLVHWDSPLPADMQHLISELSY